MDEQGVTNEIVVELWHFPESYLGKLVEEMGGILKLLCGFIIFAMKGKMLFA